MIVMSRILFFILNAIMVSVIMLKCLYSECHYAKCNYAKCHFAEISLWWMSFCWMSLRWMSLCWVSWRTLIKARRYIGEVCHETAGWLCFLGQRDPDVTKSYTAHRFICYLNGVHPFGRLKVMSACRRKTTTIEINIKITHIYKTSYNVILFN